MTKDILINDCEFTLHPAGVAFWKEQEMLLLADLHLGKVTHFRKNGIAIPSASASKTYEKLNEVVAFFNPKKICFLGDLFHSYLNSEWSLFEQWAEESLATLFLTVGNHDIIAPEKLEKAGLLLQEELLIGNLLLTHQPEEREGCFNICGHIHPGISLKGPGKQRLKLPCFYKSENQMVLPAFGEFTGKHIVTPKASDVIFAVTPKEVILVSR